MPSALSNQSRWPEAYTFARKVEEMASFASQHADSQKFSGFGAVLPNNSDGSVDLFWQGKLSKAINELIASFPELKIRVHNVSHSLEDLESRAVRAMSFSKSEALGGLTVISASVQPNASGLLVAIDQSQEFDPREVEGKLRVILGVRVQVIGSDYIRAQ